MSQNLISDKQDNPNKKILNQKQRNCKRSLFFQFYVHFISAGFSIFMNANKKHPKWVKSVL